MSIIFANIHVYLVDKPAYKFMTIMMIIIVKFSFTCTYSSNKSFMIADATISF